MEYPHLTLLASDEIVGSETRKPLRVLELYGPQAAVTDLGIVTGSYFDNSDDDKYLRPTVQQKYIPYDKSLRGRPCRYLTISRSEESEFKCINVDGGVISTHFTYNYSIRPVIHSKELFDYLWPKRVEGDNGTYEVAFGAAPLYTPSKSIQNELERKYIFHKKELSKTAGYYTYNSPKTYEENDKFNWEKFFVYEYEGKKYVRLRASCGDYKYRTSNDCLDGCRVQTYTWLEVVPVVWLMDEETNTLISKVGLNAGINYYKKPFFNRYERVPYNGDFLSTPINKYMNTYMVHDLFQYEPIFSKDKKPDIVEQNTVGITMDKLSTLERMEPIEEVRYDDYIYNDLNSPKTMSNTNSDLGGLLISELNDLKYEMLQIPINHPKKGILEAQFKWIRDYFDINYDMIVSNIQGLVYLDYRRYVNDFTSNLKSVLTSCEKETNDNSLSMNISSFEDESNNRDLRM